ncbi:hypothetical protein B0J13DRAFT_473461 [Dactylonectria estremocensis]|uniref:Zn(2)-C6 fungal-type domain-containing protein n=1 Tax=Dactylonectria estremocensis TaxID=1079267 RepID=A0A9P9EWF3_9HYPO|nr:hypothetical protein B0J13DRAFT_473461 [Dactylonectria estremocensis]
MSQSHPNDRGHSRPRRPAPEGRTLQVCFQCQDRKVKCDGNPDGCGTCKRLNFDCSISRDPSRTGEAIWKAGQLARRRIRRACIACRKRKARCSGTNPSCTQCSQREIACQYAGPEQAEVVKSMSSQRLQTSHNISTAPVDGQELSPLHTLQRSHSDGPSMSGTLASLNSTPGLGIGREVAKAHIDAFFDYVYPIPCYGFLHRATLLQSWSTGSLDPCLLNAICAVAARHVSPSDASRQTQAQAWLQNAESQLLARLGAPRLSDVETWVLIVFEQMLLGRFANMLTSMSLVARLAYLLRLHLEDGSLPFILQERRRRLMWSIYVAESLYSDGVEEFTCCNLNFIFLQLPCNERSFSMDILVKTERLPQSHELQEPSNVGLMGHCVRVLAIRAEAQRLAITITNDRKPLLDCLDAVEEIQRQLEVFHQNLPTECQFSQRNFILRAYTPSRTTWLMMHVWWHQTHCDLYRFTIPGFREGLSASQLAKLPQDYSSACWEKCLTHALSVSCILETGDKAGVDIITDPSLAICAFHSARIISRLGQYPLGSMSQEELVRRMSACSNALKKQAQVYPRSEVLMRGILDLVHDARKTPGPSIWEAEGLQRDAQPSPTLSIGARSKLREVYSTYSFTEEFCKFEFQSCETEDDTGQGGGSDAEVLPGNSSQPPPTVSSPISLHKPNEASTFISPNMATYRNPNMTSTQPQEIPLPDACELFNGTTYQYAGDSMAFGLFNQACQPDLFMDSFWPVTDVHDWMTSAAQAP